MVRGGCLVFLRGAKRYDIFIPFVLLLKIGLNISIISLIVYLYSRCLVEPIMAYKRLRSVVINDAELDKEIDELCKKEERTFSNLVRKLIRDTLEKKNKEKG